MIVCCWETGDLGETVIRNGDRDNVVDVIVIGSAIVVGSCKRDYDVGEIMAPDA